MLIEYVVHQTYGIVFLLVDDFGIYLDRLDVGVAEQFRYGVNVRSERQQYRGEGMSAGVEVSFLKRMAISATLILTN